MKESYVQSIARTMTTGKTLNLLGIHSSRSDKSAFLVVDDETFDWVNKGGVPRDAYIDALAYIYAEENPAMTLEQCEDQAIEHLNKYAAEIYSKVRVQFLGANTPGVCTIKSTIKEAVDYAIDNDSFLKGVVIHTCGEHRLTT